MYFGISGLDTMFSCLNEFLDVASVDIELADAKDNGSVVVMRPLPIARQH